MSSRVDLTEQLARALRFADAVTRPDDRAAFEQLADDIRRKIAAIDALPAPVVPH